MATTRLIRPQYTIQLKIGSEDATMRLQSIAIINSIKTSYPVILLKLNMSSKDYFVNKMYGQEDVRLEIMVTGENSVPSEVTKLDLVVIHMDNKVSMQKNSDNGNETNQLEDTITAIALIKDAYEALSTTVNFLYNFDQSAGGSGGGGGGEMGRLREFLNQGLNFAANIDDIILAPLTLINNVLGVTGATLNTMGQVFNSAGELINTIDATVNSAGELVSQIDNRFENIDNSIDRGFDVFNDTANRIEEQIDHSLNVYGGFGKSSFGSGANKAVKDKVKNIKRQTAVTKSSSKSTSYKAIKTNVMKTNAKGYWTDTGTGFDIGPVTSTNSDTGESFTDTGTGFSIGPVTQTDLDTGEVRVDPSVVPPTSGGFDSGVNSGGFVSGPISTHHTDDIFGPVTTVNFSNSGKHVPISIALDLFDNFLQDITKNIDFNNRNSIEIDQIVIPPQSFIGAIRYLNDRYGIYKGPMLLYCDLDNTLNMWDLSKATSRDVLYTVDFLAQNIDDREILTRSTETDSSFYTYFPLKVKNKTNTSIMNKGYEHIVNKSPRNKFFQTVKMTLDDIVKDFSISSRPEILCHASAKKKKTVHSIGVSGTADDTENAFITSKLARFIGSASMFSFRLKGTKIPIKKLSKVGSCIELIPHVTEYLPFSGKYIAASSVIVISREQDGNYVCNVEVTCFRESLES